jgi:hypothetical protein
MRLETSTLSAEGGHKVRERERERERYVSYKKVSIEQMLARISLNSQNSPVPRHFTTGENAPTHGVKLSPNQYTHITQYTVRDLYNRPVLCNTGCAENRFSGIIMIFQGHTTLLLLFSRLYDVSTSSCAH